MEKYISVEIPDKDIDGNRLYWWEPDMIIKAIEILERKNPKYNFFQIVSTGNNGVLCKFALMKIKNEQNIKNKDVKLIETEQ